MSSPELSFPSQALPALYHAADQTSLRSQQTYLRLFLSVLVMTSVAPGAIIVSSIYSNLLQPARLISAALLIICLLLTAKIKESQKERTWYGARAVAESVKTSAWRYAMAADPFPQSLGLPLAQASFQQTLSDILRDRKSLNYSAAGNTNNQAQITPQMAALRAASWQERLQAYVKDRLQDQRRWYSRKAADSNSKESIYFWLIIIAQLSSVVTAAAFAAWPTLHVNVTAALTASTASLLAWLQVKRYQETSQSYALAAQELGIIEAGAARVSSEEDLSRFVADAENAMSREHTLWVARRDTK